MKVIQQHDNVFLVGCDQVFEGSKYVYSIDENLYKRIEEFFNCFHDSFQEWFNRHDKPGTTYYWEENYHDKICSFLSMMMPSVAYRDISNVMSALEGELEKEEKEEKDHEAMEDEEFLALLRKL